jgi:glutaminyl-peptide cyclotransferase
MHRRQVLILTLGAIWEACGQVRPGDFSGRTALRHAQRAAGFGPRPPGSPALAQLRAWILGELAKLGCEVIRDRFTARTPLGPIEMENLIARFPGRSGRMVAVSGHYDTKWMPEIRFVGANDGGSSTGFLLELARAVSTRKFNNEILVIFFDGEESLGPWSDEDGVYGSRHLAGRWAADGTLARLKALINVDMIGDRDLGILREMNSSAWLRDLVWQTAAELGLSRYFLDQPAWIEDDHVPFIRRGASAVNLIDFEYGPGNSYWHTEQDSPDKLSAASFEVVGRVVLEVLRKLD